MKSWRKAVVGTQATVGEAIAAIESGSIQIALVLDDQNRLLGVVTDGDVRRGLLRGIPLTGLATDIMNRTPVSAPATLSRDDRLHVMRHKSIKQLPLVDEGGHLVAVETLDELLEPRHYANPVLIMAGGLGERLGALTRDVPKPMLNVGGRPLLETIVRNVVQHGFHNIYISVNYKAETIKGHFGDGAAFGANIQYVHETERLGTAGALGLFGTPPDLPMIVTNGDILTTINYGALLDFHNGTPAEATMAASLAAAAGLAAPRPWAAKRFTASALRSAPTTSKPLRARDCAIPNPIEPRPITTAVFEVTERPHETPHALARNPPGGRCRASIRGSDRPQRGPRRRSHAPARPACRC